MLPLCMGINTGPSHSKLRALSDYLLHAKHFPSQLHHHSPHSEIASSHFQKQDRLTLPYYNPLTANYQRKTKTTSVILGKPLTSVSLLQFSGRNW